MDSVASTYSKTKITYILYFHSRVSSNKCAPFRFNLLRYLQPASTCWLQLDSQVQTRPVAFLFTSRLFFFFPDPFAWNTDKLTHNTDVRVSLSTYSVNNSSLKPPYLRNGCTQNRALIMLCSCGWLCLHPQTLCFLVIEVRISGSIESGPDEGSLRLVYAGSSAAEWANKGVGSPPMCSWSVTPEDKDLKRSISQANTKEKGVY